MVGLEVVCSVRECGGSQDGSWCGGVCCNFSGGGKVVFVGSGKVMWQWVKI